jgi:hypothetical protein
VHTGVGVPRALGIYEIFNRMRQVT